MSGFNLRRERFVQEYIKDGNGAGAARRAGYSPRGADVTAVRLLGNASVQARMAEVLKNAGLDSETIVYLLAQQALSLHTQYIEVDPETGEPSLDFEGLRAAGLTHLVKGFSIGANGKPSWEFYDAQAALIILGKSTGVLMERSVEQEDAREQFAEFAKELMAAKRSGDRDGGNDDVRVT